MKIKSTGAFKMMAAALVVAALAFAAVTLREPESLQGSHGSADRGATAPHGPAERSATAQTPTGVPPASVPARLLSVVDGDTIEIDLYGARRFVRFIGIDAPEKRANRKARRDSVRERRPVEHIVRDGLAARAWLASMMSPGDTVWLEFGHEKEDHYGRLLCFVHHLGAGHVNLEMVRSGYARPMAISPNTTRAAEFNEAADRARADARGLWAGAWGAKHGR